MQLTNSEMNYPLQVELLLPPDREIHAPMDQTRAETTPITFYLVDPDRTRGKAAPPCPAAGMAPEDEGAGRIPAPESLLSVAENRLEGADLPPRPWRRSRSKEKELPLGILSLPTSRNLGSREAQNSCNSPILKIFFK